MEQNKHIQGRLICIYDDVVGRLSNDADTCWKLTIILLAIIAYIGTAKDLKCLALAVALFTVVLSVISLCFFICSVLIYRDLNLVLRCKFAEKMLLDTDSREARKIAKNIIDEAPNSVFHTGDIIERARAGIPGSYIRYLHDIREDLFRDDFTRYIFFLACMIEIRKPARWRGLIFFALTLLLFAILSILRIFLGQ